MIRFFEKCFLRIASGITLRAYLVPTAILLASIQDKLVHRSCVRPSCRSLLHMVSRHHPLCSIFDSSLGPFHPSLSWSPDEPGSSIRSKIPVQSLMSYFLGVPKAIHLQKKSSFASPIKFLTKKGLGKSICTDNGIFCRIPRFINGQL